MQSWKRIYPAFNEKINLIVETKINENNLLFHADHENFNNEHDTKINICILRIKGDDKSNKIIKT